MANKKKGIKHDSGKPAISLIPVEFIVGMAKVFTIGAKEYGKHNFRQGMDHSRLLDAMARHWLAIVRGEDIDPDSGEPHWAHLGCEVAMYAFCAVNNKGKDDRYSYETKRTRRRHR